MLIFPVFGMGQKLHQRLSNAQFRFASTYGQLSTSVAGPFRATSGLVLRSKLDTGPGCVKTRLGKGGAELFPQLPSPETSCQYSRLSHRRN